MAATEFQTELYLAKNAFNCFCGNKRMTTENGRDIVYISAIDGVPLAKTKQGTTLYLVMYHKKTENGVIDTQEFEYLILKF